MLPKKYRVTRPMLALLRDDGEYVARMVLVGATITVLDGEPFNGDRLTVVEWEGKAVMIFTEDLRRGTEEWAGDEHPSDVRPG